MLYFEGNLGGPHVRPMEWRQCHRFPAYEVSEYGDLRHIPTRPTRRRSTSFAGFVDVDGYVRYSVVGPDGRKCSVAAYVLVAEAFIGPKPSDKHEVAHDNGSRVCCDYRQLRWATRAENDSDRIAHGTNPAGENNGRAKITEDDVHFIRREYRRVKTHRVRGGLVALEQRFDLHRGTIIRIAKGESWRHVPMRPDLYSDE